MEPIAPAASPAPPRPASEAMSIIDVGVELLDADVVEVWVETVVMSASDDADAPAETTSAVETVARLRTHQARLASGWTRLPAPLEQLPARTVLAATVGQADGGAEAEKLAGLEELLGYRFRDRRTLGLALIHSSSSARPLEDNERLEFLGDAVLDLVVREYCYHQYPDRHEGELTEAKAAVVCRAALARAARRLGLQPYLHIGRDLGKRQKIPESLVANAYEAVVAALYLDGGYAPARNFVMETLGGDLAGALADAARTRNPKSALQQVAQSRWHCPPQYRVVDQHGPDHDRVFEVAVFLGGVEKARGKGASKKDAEQAAARAALEGLDALPA